MDWRNDRCTYICHYRIVLAMEFDWDEAKNRENRKNHGVSFETARDVFDDPTALTQPDSVHSDDEPRWNTLGAVGPGSVLFVVHIWRGEETIRIISARVATSR